MKELFAKALSHLSKNTLTTIVIIMAMALGKFAYEKLVTLIVDKQTSIEKKVDAGFKKSSYNDSIMKMDIKNIQLDVGAIDGKQDIVIGTLPEIKRQQIKQYEQLYNQIRQDQRKNPLKTDDESYIAPVSKEVGLLDNDVPDIKKKLQTLQALN